MQDDSQTNGSGTTKGRGGTVLGVDEKKSKKATNACQRVVLESKSN